MLSDRLRAGLAVFMLVMIGAPVAYADGLVTPTVLITGSSRGIGFELARQYAERGWGVIATCRTPESAGALQALAESHSNVVIERLDVTDFAGIDIVAEKYRQVPIDVLINNAGILFGGQVFYRASKAALNMSMRTLAKELRRSDQPGRKALIFGLIDPGIVDTGFAKNVPIPMIQADESAAAVITVIDSYDRKTSATFLRYTGQKMPW